VPHSFGAGSEAHTLRVEIVLPAEKRRRRNRQSTRKRVRVRGRDENRRGGLGGGRRCVRETLSCHVMCRVVSCRGSLVHARVARRVLKSFGFRFHSHRRRRRTGGVSLSVGSIASKTKKEREEGGGRWLTRRERERDDTDEGLLVSHRRGVVGFTRTTSKVPSDFPFVRIFMSTRHPCVVGGDGGPRLRLRQWDVHS